MFLFIYDYRSEKEQFVSGYSLTQDEKELLQDGDIILRHGYGFVSDAITKALNEKYSVSHCGIVCKKNNKIKIIHTVSQSLSSVDGVQKHSLDKFIRDSQKNSVIVVRYKPLIAKELSVISKKAEYYLKQKIPFDHAFDLNDSTAFYCTELIWKILLTEYNDDIFYKKINDNKDHLRFETFWDTSKFDIIINHFERVNE